MSWYWYVIGALGLALLMVVHECGHFFIARAYGMRVTKFSIGFGPTFFQIVPENGYYWFTTAAGRLRLRMWRHDVEKHGPTIYQVGMIPFLAFVQIAGMNPLEEIDETDKGSYANASLMGRILTIFGGPAANYLFASVLFFGSVFWGGRDVRGTEVQVIDGSRAAAAHFKTGDRIVEIDHTPVEEWDRVAELISHHPEHTIPIVVQRGGERITLDVTPENKHGEGKIGVRGTSPSHKVPVSAKEAAVHALKAPVGVVKGVVVGLSEWAAGRAEGELSGPVGIVKETAKAAQLGATYLLYLLGVLSAYLGAFNLLPFPALDGGRLMFLGYEATTRRRPNARIEAHIHFIGLAMMVGLMVYVTFVNDLRLTGRPAPQDPAAPPSAAPPATATPSAAPSTAPDQGGK